MFIQAALLFLQTILHSTNLKAGNIERDTYPQPFYCNFDNTCLFSVHACANIKQVPGYKETYLGVQLLDSYLDNWLSVPALHIILYT